MATESIVVSSGFDEYQLSIVLGEGGAGRVYAATSSDGTEVAVKVLLHGATTDKKKRFKNELRFLERNEHKNIVTVIDRGHASDRKLTGPFYVMRRYGGSLRTMLDRDIPPANVLPLFSQILDGVEAAHLQGAVHRDLKPENVLFEGPTPTLAVADFGCARFGVNDQVTAVETREGQRLANFRYSAPEQRTPGEKVNKPADIFALGLMLNEMFTGNVAQGVDYPTISAASPEHAYLDAVVQRCISHSPSARPATVAELKSLIQRLGDVQLSEQKLSAISGRVIKIGEIDDPLAEEPPKLVDFEYDFTSGTLRLILDRPVGSGWVDALRRMGTHQSVWGKPPAAFNFEGRVASIAAQDDDIQPLIDHFKPWLPLATAVYKSDLAAQLQRDVQLRQAELEGERALEARKLKVLANIKI